MNLTRWEIPHLHLIFFGIGCLMLNPFGPGFFLLRAVNQEIYEMGTNPDPRERLTLYTAKGLTVLSIVLFVGTWLGLVVLITTHRPSSTVSQ